jgi:ADP-heptose:LPS heptosyltransferase
VRGSLPMLDRLPPTGLPAIKQLIFKRALAAMARLNRTRSGLRSVPAPGQVRNLAVMHFGGIGDMVLITPALNALARHYPDARISVIGSNRNHCSFLRNFPFVDDIRIFDIYALDSRGIVSPPAWKALSGFVTWLRDKNVDLLVNFHSPWLIDWFVIEFLVACLTKPRFSAGINPYFLRDGSVFDRWLSEDDLEGKHDKDFFCDLVEQMGISVADRDTRFPLGGQDREFARTLIRKRGLDPERMVCIHPGSSVTANLWPIDRYRELTAVLGRQGFLSLVIGSREEEPVAADLARDNPRVMNLTGQTTLEQTASLIEASALFVGNDSGPLHMAAALKTPAIGLVGGGHPRFHLYNRDDIRIIKSDVPCAPCRNWNCTTTECMKKIPLETVLQAAAGLIERRPRETMTKSAGEKG